MFAHKVFIKLKRGKNAAELTERLEKMVLPLLRSARGFRDVISFMTLGRTEVLAISMWDNKASADAYNRDKYPEVLEALEGLLNGSPRVESCVVGMSTYQELVAPPGYATTM
jgi:heme-degrading monooxygenase HmoA